MENQETIYDTDSGIDSDGTSASDETSQPIICTICLDQCRDRCFIMPCIHEYCFDCLRKWMAVKVECPLCKQTVKSIIRKVKAIDQFEEYYIQDPTVDLPIPSLDSVTSLTFNDNLHGNTSLRIYNLHNSADGVYALREPSRYRTISNSVYGPHSRLTVIGSAPSHYNINGITSPPPYFSRTHTNVILPPDLGTRSASRINAHAQIYGLPITQPTLQEQQQQQQQPQLQQEQQQPRFFRDQYPIANQNLELPSSSTILHDIFTLRGPKPEIVMLDSSRNSNIGFANEVTILNMPSLNRTHDQEEVVLNEADNENNNVMMGSSSTSATFMDINSASADGGTSTSLDVSSSSSGRQKNKQQQHLQNDDVYDYRGLYNVGASTSTGLRSSAYIWPNRNPLVPMCLNASSTVTRLPSTLSSSPNDENLRMPTANGQVGFDDITNYSNDNYDSDTDDADRNGRIEAIYGLLVDDAMRFKKMSKNELIIYSPKMRRLNNVKEADAENTLPIEVVNEPLQEQQQHQQQTENLSEVVEQQQEAAVSMAINNRNIDSPNTAEVIRSSVVNSNANNKQLTSRSPNYGETSGHNTQQKQNAIKRKYIGDDDDDDDEDDLDDVGNFCLSVFKSILKGKRSFSLCADTNQPSTEMDNDVVIDENGVRNENENTSENGNENDNMAKDEEEGAWGGASRK